jgi:hypothetical protein
MPVSEIQRERQKKAMPTFEIGLDDGRKIQIDADDQQSALAGAQHFLQQAVKSLPTPTPFRLEG